MGAESDILYKKIHIGEYFLSQKDTTKAIQILKEANQLAVKIKNSNEILTSLKFLSKIDKTHRLFYANEYIKLSDSINTLQKTLIISMPELNMKPQELRMKIKF